MWPRDSWVLAQVAATTFLTELGKSHTEQMKLCLPIIVPVLTGATADSKLQVKVRARRARPPCRNPAAVHQTGSASTYCLLNRGTLSGGALRAIFTVR